MTYKRQKTYGQVAAAIYRIVQDRQPVPMAAIRKLSLDKNASRTVERLVKHGCLARIEADAEIAIVIGAAPFPPRRGPAPKENTRRKKTPTERAAYRRGRKIRDAISLLEANGYIVQSGRALSGKEGV